mmetsp:Transcript_4499/g.6880  ORF Transcript_4499/g.6880 Transcript_4499/m.6880 type:complete len:210 (-) Transcript_4499:1319-1948(-)
MSHSTLMHSDATILTPSSVFIPRNHHFEPALIETFFVHHTLEAFFCCLHETVCFILEDLVHEVQIISRPHCRLVSIDEIFLNPGRLVGKGYNSSIGSGTFEVSIIEGVTGISACKSRGICGVHVDCFKQSQKVTLGLAHFLCINHDESIRVITPGPKLRLVLPDSGVIIQCHCKVVRNKIFTRNAKIHWVPVPKFSLHLLKSFTWNCRI